MQKLIFLSLTLWAPVLFGSQYECHVKVADADGFVVQEVKHVSSGQVETNYLSYDSMTPYLFVENFSFSTNEEVPSVKSAYSLGFSMSSANGGQFNFAVAKVTEKFGLISYQELSEVEWSLNPERPAESMERHTAGSILGEQSELISFASGYNLSISCSLNSRK